MADVRRFRPAGPGRVSCPQCGDKITSNALGRAAHMKGCLDRQINFHLDEIDAWQSGAKATPGCPATGERYPGRMADAIRRHEQALRDLGYALGGPRG